MENQISINNTLDTRPKFEVVERKGAGHPDTLADELAERLSIAYSQYCLVNFGVILHHNFDKVGMMGGLSKVGFGIGEMISPIRVLINGRASSMFGDTKIDVKQILLDEVNFFFSEKFPHIKYIDKTYRVLWEVTDGSSPGAICQEDSYRQHWFKPRNKNDLSELSNLNCNDTSMGFGYKGQTELEEFVSTVERQLNSIEFKVDKPWLGSDIKLMCCRFENDVSLTLCVPQIGLYVENLEQYKANLEIIKEQISKVAKNVINDKNLTVNINMRDKFDNSAKDLYLTYTGSSIEMGDEGFVGRGNRIGGLITPNRFYTMEGIAGKNPVYHTGKMYSVFAMELSKIIHQIFGYKNEIILVGMTGQNLLKPHRIIINIESINELTQEAFDEISATTTKYFDEIKINDISKNILEKKYEFY